jgi:hypothetical protein
VKSATVPIRANVARRVLGATSLLFLSGNAFLFSHSGTVDANLQKTGAGSFGKQSILRTPARPAERECSAGCFLCNQPGLSSGKTGELTMRSLVILVAICFSGTVFVQSAPPKVVQVKPKAPMGCKLVGTVRGTKLWAGDCIGSELKGSTTTTEKQALPEEATGSITPDQKE